MAPLSKNGAYRLRKTQAHLERALDQLYQVQGVLYPAEMSAFREKTVALIAGCQSLGSAIEKALGNPATKKQPAAGKASEPQDDPFEEAAE